MGVRLCSFIFLLILVTSCMCVDDRKSCQGNGQIATLSSGEVVHASVVHRARVNIKGSRDNSILGKVTIKKDVEGLKIIADIDGLKPGKHGFYIYQFGDCSTVGEPSNPMGDLGDLEANVYGHAHYEKVDKSLTFVGEKSILGKPLIIYEGSAEEGERIACGLILATE